MRERNNSRMTPSSLVCPTGRMGKIGRIILGRGTTVFILVLVEFEISTGGSSGEPVGSWVWNLD